MENEKKVWPPVRRERKKTAVNTRLVALVVAVVLVVGSAVGATLAWFTDKTENVVNTFTVGNIDIDLTETTGTEYKMVPGTTITKDPFVTVKAGSEKCYVFVELAEDLGSWEDDVDSFKAALNYDIADGWTAGTGASGNGVPVGVYYRVVDTAIDDQPFYVLKGVEQNGKLINQISVSSAVTKGMMDELEKTNDLPTLTVTAYAVQFEAIADAAAAWAIAKPSTP